MTSHFRVVDYVVRQLVAAGVDHMFGVDGANIEDLYDAAHFCAGITAVLAKHESSAAAMADGYSRTGCGLGVVMATSGGGSLNLVPGLGESLASRVPVLALVGQPPTTMDGLGSFQDTSGSNGALNAEALFSAVSLDCRRVTDPTEIVAALSDAIAAARRGGPAVLLLPKDIQQSELRHASSPIQTILALPTPSPSGDLRTIIRILSHTHGPVSIIAGEQVARDDAREELELLRSLLNASIATVPDAKDVSGPSETSLGVTGVMGHPGVAEAITKSAVCLVIGTRLNVTSRAGLDEALSNVQLLSIGSGVPYLPCRHVTSSDLRTSLETLAIEISVIDGMDVLPRRVVNPRAELTPPPSDAPGIRYRDAIDALDTVLPDGVDIVVDAGNSGAAAIHNLPVRRSGRFVVALGMGGMGYSFGAGIGMAFGRVVSGSARRTMVIAGDGSFFMHGMEVHTAVQYRLPITFVLFNNNAHAMCVTREQLYYQDLYSYNRFQPSLLGAGLAAMFPGLHSVDVSDPEALPGVLRDAISVDGPSVVSIECSADEIPPFAPFLNQIDHQQHSVTTPKKKEAGADVRARA